MTEPNGGTIAYSYDSSGDRLTKTVTTGGPRPTTTQLKDVYQGGRIAYETDGANTILATFAADPSQTRQADPLQPLMVGVGYHGK